MNTFQNIKYFDKNGLEIPIVKASNIVIRTSDGLDDIIFNGIYNNKKDSNGNFIIDELQLVNKGSILNEIVDTLELDVYVDGNKIEEKCVISGLNKTHFERFYQIDYACTSKDFIANSEDENVKYGISHINGTNISCIIPEKYDLIYPSIAFSGKINIDRISTGLVENNSIFLAIENAESFDTPIDDDYDLVFVTNENEKEIRFFTIDSLNESVKWGNKVIVDLSKERLEANEDEDIIIDNNLLPQVNIGFVSETEGIFEQIIYVLIKNRVTGEEYKIGEFLVCAEAVGEDERYRALFANFGIPDPITYPHLFKDAHPDEDKTDWQLINDKSKELFLSYKDIFPYVGTYKALINAVNFLGYNDIYFREWYKKLDTGKLVSYRIDVNDIFNDTDIRTHIGLNEKILRKKLNHLTMVYYINKENGETDEYNIPIVENVYDYSIDEILVKLISLKEWLEKNIIALNCRIIDITGEGVVYERIDHNIYGMYMQNIEYDDILNVDAALINKTVELIDGSANIDVSMFRNSNFKEMELDEIKELRFEDFLYSGDVDKESQGPTLEYPIIYNGELKAYVDTSNAIIGYYGENNPDNFTDKGLWINNGEIYFPTNELETTTSSIMMVDENGNEYDTNIVMEKKSLGYKQVLFNNGQCPIIQLQSAVFRDDNADWYNNERYIIESTNYKDYSYSIINILTGKCKYSNDYIILYPTDNASLRYTMDNSYDVPMFKIKGYKLFLYNESLHSEDRILNETFLDPNHEYIIEIRDGKMINRHNENSEKITCLNFHYDNDAKEQNVSVTVQYTKSFTYDWDKLNEDKSLLDFNKVNGTICSVNVNNIGEYNLVVYAYNKNGNVYAYKIPEKANVIMENSKIFAYTHIKESENNELFREEKTYGEKIDKENYNLFEYTQINYNNETPIFRDNYMNSYLTYNYKDGSCWIKYPNISYAIDTPKPNDYIQIMDICDSFDATKMGEYNGIKVSNYYMFTSKRFNPHNYFLADKESIITEEITNYEYLLANAGSEKIDKDLIPVGDKFIYGEYYVRGIDSSLLNTINNDPDLYTSDMELELNKIYSRDPKESSGETTVVTTVINYKELCYCNVIFYNRLKNSAEAEFTGIIKERDKNNKKYIIIFEDDNVNKEVEKYIENIIPNDNNISIYVQPIGEHNISAVGFVDNNSNTNLTAMTVENYNSVYNNTSIFRKGDNIKVIYEVRKHKEVTVFITSNTPQPLYFEKMVDENGNEKFYRDGIYNENEYIEFDGKEKFYLINIENNLKRQMLGTVHIRYKNVGDNPIYKGYTTFRVHSFDPTTKTLVLDGKYNYQQYLAEFLLGYTSDGDIAEDIKTSNDGYYIITYKDSDGAYKNVKLRNLEAGNSNYTAEEMFTSIKVAHAHQKYVRYKMQVNDAIELPNGHTQVFTDKNRLYDYLDGTFSFVAKSFDIDNAFNMWMKPYDDPNDNENRIPEYLVNLNKKDIYAYKFAEPFTLRISNEFINDKRFKADIDKNIIIYTESDKIKDLKVYWKVYKQNISNKTRELLFEVLNDKLYLSITEKGLYDIVACVYDTYGNLIETEYEAFINAI